MAGRLIFHCDGNNFFASCECIEHPEWRDVPMAVAGDPKDRCGIVVAKNELAKKAGVKTTDTIWQARQKCPNILFVPPHHDEYARVSRRMNAIFREYTDFVEPASIDESYLDMTGAPGFYGLSPRELADLLRRRVREEIGITISVGVSFCKVFAKMGSDYRKPDATTLIFRENYQEMLYPLPVATMLYAGRASVQTMARHGIRTIYHDIHISPVRHHCTFKSPLIPKNMRTQIFVSPGKNTIDFVEGCHDTCNLRIAYQHFKRLQINFPGRTFCQNGIHSIIISLAVSSSESFLFIYRKVFGTH